MRAATRHRLIAALAAVAVVWLYLTTEVEVRRRWYADDRNGSVSDGCVKNTVASALLVLANLQDTGISWHGQRDLDARPETVERYRRLIAEPSGADDRRVVAAEVDEVSYFHFVARHSASLFLRAENGWRRTVSFDGHDHPSADTGWVRQ